MCWICLLGPPLHNPTLVDFLVVVFIIIPCNLLKPILYYIYILLIRFANVLEGVFFPIFSSIIKKKTKILK